jgi:membrane protein DedA with SNARE-associated domain
VVDWILGQPFVLAAALLAMVAALRSQCTYWLGRAIRAGVIRGARAERLRSQKVAKAVAKLERWGWPLIPASFLTVGFQTAVHLSAGLMAWRWPHYTFAAAFGWVMWGCVYAAGGLAAFAAVAALVSSSPLRAVASLKIVAVVVAVVAFLRSEKLRERLTFALDRVVVDD